MPAPGWLCLAAQPGWLCLAAQQSLSPRHRGPPNPVLSKAPQLSPSFLYVRLLERWIAPPML